MIDPDREKKEIEWLDRLLAEQLQAEEDDYPGPSQGSASLGSVAASNSSLGNGQSGSAVDPKFVEDTLVFDDIVTFNEQQADFFISKLEKFITTFPCIQAITEGSYKGIFYDALDYNDYTLTYLMGSVAEHPEYFHSEKDVLEFLNFFKATVQAAMLVKATKSGNEQSKKRADHDDEDGKTASTSISGLDADASLGNRFLAILYDIGGIARKFKGKSSKSKDSDTNTFADLFAYVENLSAEDKKLLSAPLLKGTYQSFMQLFNKMLETAKVAEELCNDLVSTEIPRIIKAYEKFVSSNSRK